VPNPPLPSKADPRADINKDGIVNAADLSIILANMNRPVSVPVTVSPVPPFPCADRRSLPRRILLLALSQMGLESPTNPKGWNRDWSQKTVGAENADLFTIFSEYVYRALTDRSYQDVMVWGASGISREKDGDSWPGVFPLELPSVLSPSEYASLITLLSLIDTCGARPIPYIGHTQLPWLAGELHTAAPGKNSAANFSDAGFQQSFANSTHHGGDMWHGVALDAFAILMCENPAAALEVLRKIASLTNFITWVEGPIPHADPTGTPFPDTIIQSFHRYAVEIGVIDGGLDKEGNPKDITQSRDWLILTDPNRRALISSLVPNAGAAVMANGSNWTNNQIAILRRACDTYGWTEISAFVD